jgi:hypothetical protein
LKWKKAAAGKLLPLFVGPFEIAGVKPSGTAVTINLPPSFRCKRTWNLRHLKPWTPSTTGLAPPVTDWTTELYDLLDPVQDLDPEHPLVPAEDLANPDADLCNPPMSPVQSPDHAPVRNLRPRHNPVPSPAVLHPFDPGDDEPMIDSHLDMFDDDD